MINYNSVYKHKKENLYLIPVDELSNNRIKCIIIKTEPGLPNKGGFIFHGPSLDSSYELALKVGDFLFSNSEILEIVSINASTICMTAFDSDGIRKSYWETNIYNFIKDTYQQYKYYESTDPLLDLKGSVIFARGTVFNIYNLDKSCYLIMNRHDRLCKILKLKLLEFVSKNNYTIFYNGQKNA